MFCILVQMLCFVTSGEENPGSALTRLAPQRGPPPKKKKKKNVKEHTPKLQRVEKIQIRHK